MMATVLHRSFVRARRLWALLACVALAVVAACVPPRRGPVSGARLAASARPAVDEGPFRVVFQGPQGEAPQAREVTIAFSRPVRPADAAGAGAPAARVTRAHDGVVVDGSWSWFGDRTAVFWPKDGFARGTAFDVAVDPAIRALDGASLEPVAPFRFVSARPSIEAPEYAFDEKDGRHRISFGLDQPVSEGALRTAISVVGTAPATKRAQTIPFTIEGIDHDRVTLVVDEMVRGLSGVTIVAAPTLTGIDGPLPSGREIRLPVPDVGPLAATLSCTPPGGGEPVPGATRCSLERGSISLTFSKSVDASSLRRHFAFDAPRLEGPGDDDDGPTSVVMLDTHHGLEAGRRYKVTLRAGLQAVDKERLAADRVIVFETADESPEVVWRDLPPDGVIEAARPAITFHLLARNTPRIEAVRAPLPVERLFDVLYGPRTAEAVRALPGSVTSTLVLDGRRNATVKARFDLPPAMRAPGAKGLFALAASAPGQPDTTRVIAVTDLGLTVKWSPHGGLVWVTRLSTAMPVAKATVSLRRHGAPVWETTTDDDGLAVVPDQVAATFQAAPADAAVVARSDDDLAFMTLPELDTSLVPSLGILFPDRRLYRPGETFYLKGIFRSPSAQGLVPLPGRPVEIEAVDSDERLVFATTATIDAFGGFSAEATIPRTAPLGFARVRARIASSPLPRPNAQAVARRRSVHGDEWTATTRIVVDEFRTVDIKVDAELDRPVVMLGDAVKLRVAGSYLFGAPMHDAAVSVRARRSPVRLAPRDLAGFTTDARALAGGGPGGAPQEDVFADFELKLGPDGAATRSVPIALKDPSGPEEVSFETTLEDVTRSFAVGADAKLLVHPAELYVGLRLPASETPAAKATIHPEVVVADWSGIRRSDVPVRVELLERRDAAAAPTASACEVKTKADPVACGLSIGGPGTYYVRATSLDPHGRSIIAALSFEIPDERPAPPRRRPAPVKEEPPPKAPRVLSFAERCRLEPSPDDRRPFLTETVERREHPVGSSVQACMRPGGPTLLTFEREGVLQHRLFPAAVTERSFDVPISAALHPDVLLAAHRVSPRRAPFVSGSDARSRDPGPPSAAAGADELRIAQPPEKKLLLAWDAAPNQRPGAEMEARVRVTDAKGTPVLAQVTLWAVDEGVLQLEPYSVPDPAGAMHVERGSDVLTIESRDALFWERGTSSGIHHVKSPSLRQGSTQVGAGPHIGRSIFRPTAWFFPSLVTGPDGVASVRARLPDNVTTWKVFAVAQTATEGFGALEASFMTNKPLLARPALPRSLRRGDRFEATATIDWLEKRKVDVRVSMLASGALSGERVTTLTIGPEGHVPVAFPVTAGAPGSGRVRFRVEAPRERLVDEVTIDEEVTWPASLETVVLAGQTRGHVDEPLGDLSGARTDVGGVDYRLAPSPLVGLGDSLGALIDYPYGCTEQLASRLVPLVRLRSLARDLDVTLPSDVDGSVRTAIASLLTHQRSDGGFGFWPESEASEPALTVLALSALEASARGGFAVPTSAIDRAFAYIEHAKDLDVAERAMREDLFAASNRPREKELRALAGEPLPDFARALVAHALAGVDRPLASRLLATVTSHARRTGATAIIADEPTLESRRYLSSDARTTAIVLRALVAVEPASPLVPPLVGGLLSLRREGRWRTTQESAWALAALDEARGLFPPAGGRATLLLDGKELVRGHAGRATSGTVPMRLLAGASGGVLSFATDGGPLFYEATLRFARRDPPASAVAHGIHVARSYRVLRADGTSSDTATFHVGDYVEVDALAASPVARDLVVLEDPIPAGFEAVNQRFANADRMTRRPDPSHEVTHRELRDDRVVTFFDRLPGGVTHTTYLLRAIAPGRFSMPPAKAECMYQPDVYGRSTAGVVEIVR